MKRSLSLTILLLALAGCQSQNPVMNGGFYQSPYNGIGVDGPGPGVASDGPHAQQMGGMDANAAIQPVQYQQVALQTGYPGAPEGLLPPPGVMTSQVNFNGLESLVIRWDANVPGTFDSEPFICPATHDFGQGHVYRLKLTNIPNRPGRELFPTLEIAPTSARTQAFLAHSSIPVEFTDNDFDQVLSGNYITKVVYLPNPEYQGIAMSGVGTLVNTQLQPGVDPIVEASKRGSILAVIRMGNKDLSLTLAEQRRNGFFSAEYPSGNGSIPQNAISGINVPQFGTPMTKTTTGVPGPPQLPQGEIYLPNRQDVVRTEPIPAPPAVRTYPQLQAPQAGGYPAPPTLNPYAEPPKPELR